MYSHLDQIFSAFNKLAPAGDPIGTVGTANNNYPAHLHLEIHDTPWITIGPGYKDSPGHCLDPRNVIKENQRKDPTSLHRSALATIIEDQIKKTREQQINIQRK